MMRHSDEDEVHPENNPVLRLVRRVIPSTTEYDGQKLFTLQNGKRLATPLLAVLIVIETSDVVFAVDSIPAILAVSREQFIVFSSNAFAILGLRALYFLLADLRDKFSYLQQGLAVILAFVGVKMIIAEWYHIPTWASLGVIAVVLAVSIWLSIRKDAREAAAASRPPSAGGLNGHADGTSDAVGDPAAETAGARPGRLPIRRPTSPTRGRAPGSARAAFSRPGRRPPTTRRRSARARSAPPWPPSPAGRRSSRRRRPTARLRRPRSTPRRRGPRPAPARPPARARPPATRRPSR